MDIERGGGRQALLWAAVAVAGLLVSGCGETSAAEKKTGAGGGPPGSVAPVPSAKSPRVEPPSAKPSSAASPSAEPVAVNSCSPDGFLIRGEEPNAAMGLRAMGVELVNCGTKTYTLNGYPKVRVLGDKHEALEVNVVNGTTSVKDAGPKPLTLKPGESAQTVLVWRNTATEGVSQEGAYLEITPKTGARTQTIAELIDLGTTGKLELTAWQVRERG